MSGSGRRAVVVLAGVTVVLVVVLLQVAPDAGERVGAGGFGGRDVSGQGQNPDSQVVVGEWTPVGVVPAASRVRGWDDGGQASVVEVLRTRLAGLASAGVAGIAVGAVVYWALSRPDWYVARAVRRTVLASRRGPPRPAFA
jgi:hypothetical protein